MIKEQFWADIVVFDSEKVNDTAAYNNPHHYATGIPFVLLNGVPIIKFNTPARSLASD